MNKRAASSIGTVFGVAGFAAGALGLLYRWPLGNIIGLDGLTSYAAVFPIWALLFVICTACLPSAVARLTAGRAAQGDYLGAQDVLIGSGASALVIGIILTLPLLIFSKQITAFMGLADASGSLKTAAPLFLIMLTGACVTGYFKGLQLNMPPQIAVIISNFFKLLAGLLAAHFMIDKGAGYGALGGTLGILIAETLAFAFIILMYVSNYSVFQREIQSSKNARNLPYMAVIAKVWSIALPVICGFALSPLTMLMDNFLTIPMLLKAGYSAEIASCGFGMLSGIALPMACVLMPVMTAFISGITPQITAFRVRKNNGGVRLAASASLKAALIVGLPCGAGLIVLAKPITALLFNSILTEAEVDIIASLLRTLGFGVPFLALSIVGAGLLSGMKKSPIAAFSTLLALIVKLALMLIMVRNENLNIQGAAFSSTMAFLTAGVLNASWAITVCGIRINLFDHFAKPLICAGGMALVAFLTYEFLLQQFLGVIAGGIIAIMLGVVLYLALCFTLQVFEPNEAKFLPGAELFISQ